MIALCSVLTGTLCGQARRCTQVRTVAVVAAAVGLRRSAARLAKCEATPKILLHMTMSAQCQGNATPRRNCEAVGRSPSEIDDVVDEVAVSVLLHQHRVALVQEQADHELRKCTRQDSQPGWCRGQKFATNASMDNYGTQRNCPEVCLDDPVTKTSPLQQLLRSPCKANGGQQHSSSRGRSMLTRAVM